MYSWPFWPVTSTENCEKAALFHGLVNVVAIMLRTPVAGAVKPRLAMSLGEEAALGSYRQLVEFLLQRLGRPWPIHIHHTPDKPDEMKNWLGDAYLYIPQVGADLGERLIHAMEWEFARGVKKLLFLGGGLSLRGPGQGGGCLSRAGGLRRCYRTRHRWGLLSDRSQAKPARALSRHSLGKRRGIIVDSGQMP